MLAPARKAQAKNLSLPNGWVSKCLCLENHVGFGWVLLIVGLFVAGIGLVWIISPSVPWLGRLPGDIRVEGNGIRFYFPLGSCLLLSLILSGLICLIRWWFRR